ncbi:MAG: DUF3656 domain-containing protein, partial [Bacteroidales bacterium]
HGDKVLTNQRKTVIKGSQLFRNYNREFERELEVNMPERLLDVNIKFISYKEKLILTAICEDGREVVLCKENNFDLARDVSAKERTMAQLKKKTGIYKFDIKEYQVEQQLFYPVSFLNECRRELASLLDQKEPIINLHSVNSTLAQDRETKKIISNSIKNKIIDYRGNVANSLARELYLELGAKSVADAFEITAPKEIELMRSKYCIKFELEACPFNKKHQKGVARGVIEPLFLENSGKRFRLGFDCKKCEMIIFG